MANGVVQAARLPVSRRRSSGRRLARHKSIIAFLMALPLIVLIAALVIYPALYSLHLATLNKSMEHFVGLGNFAFLFKRELFWMVIKQTVVFAVSAVIFKALIGFVVAHFVHNIPAKGQRKWRGMLLVPWVIPPAMSTLAWLWLFDPSYSAFNWILERIGLPQISWLGNPNWALPTVVFHAVYETWFKALLESNRRSTLCFSLNRKTRPAEAFRLNCIGPEIMLRPASPHAPASGRVNAAWFKYNPGGAA